MAGFMCQDIGIVNGYQFSAFNIQLYAAVVVRADIIFSVYDLY